MDSFSFNTLINELKKHSVSSNKVDIIRTALAGAKGISATQVAAILKLLSFDSTQLEVAKMAYPYAIDQGAYAIIVGDAFNYSSSKDELKKFIQNY